jgi:hypothetical protein
MLVRVWVWKGLAPLLVRFCREYGVPFNQVVNRAVECFLGICDREELQLLARREALLREEAELRRVCNAMLRSGSYLPGYAQKVLREPGRSMGFVRDGQVPLKALNPGEERVFRKILSRREEIAGEIAAVQLQLLKDVKPFRLKPDLHRRVRRSGRSGSLRSDSQLKGGECVDGVA